MVEDDKFVIDDLRIKRCIQTAASIVNSDTVPDYIKSEVSWRLNIILTQCSAIDSSNETDVTSSMLDIIEQAFWIGKYSPTADLVRLIESFNQSDRAKLRLPKHGDSAEKGWRLIARSLVIRLSTNTKSYSANSLAEAVIGIWENQKPPPPSVKIMALFIAKLAAEADCAFSLTVDGRAKKVRK